MEKYLFRPEGAYFGDCMPFFNKETSEYYLYYQRDTRNPVPFGEPFGWNLLVTKDFVTFSDYGEVLEHGREHEQDQFIYAGTVFEMPNGKKASYYTGFNRNLIGSTRPSQVLMQAESKDGIVWKKSGILEFLKPQKGYDPDDWRDPFIIWDEEQKEYLLILGTRLEGPKKEKTGRIVYYTSKDYETWDFKGDFWSPEIYTMIEMPEIVKIGPYWYLLYSEYDDKKTTHYCFSENIRGPWSLPKQDTFAGRAYYAARTVSNGNNHTLVGWVPSKEAGKDENNYLWGGTLLPLEIIQLEDGLLRTRLPETISEAIEESFSISDNNLISIGKRLEKTIRTGLTKHYYVKSEFSFKEGTKNIQFLFYQDISKSESYMFDLDIESKRLRVTRTPNLRWFQMMNIGLEKYIDLSPNDINEFELLVDDTIAYISINGVTLSCRVEKNIASAFSIAVIDGEVKFI